MAAAAAVVARSRFAPDSLPAPVCHCADLRPLILHTFWEPVFATGDVLLCGRPPPSAGEMGGEV